MALETAPIEPDAIYGSTLLDASGQPNIVIDSSQVHELIWTLINNQDKELVVTPFPSGNVGQNQYHFKFDFTPGAITSLVTVEGWEIFSVKDGKGIKTLYVAFSGTKPISLAPKTSKQTGWFYTRAVQEDPNNSKVMVHLTTGNNVVVGGSTIPNKIIGLTDLNLVHENAPALSAPPLAIDFVGRRTVLNDGQTTNSFTFALTNMMQADLTLKPNSTILTVWFDAAPNEAGQGYPSALARKQDLDSKDFDLAKPGGDWTINKNVTLLENVVVSPRWTITVVNPVVLKPQDPVLFTFKGLKTNLDPGVTRMYLRFENVSDFRPAVLIAELEKTPLLYGDKHGQGLYFSAGIPDAKTPPAPNYDSGLYVQQFGKGAAAIFNGGRVGIGTGANTPAAKLQILDDDQNPADAGTLILGPGNLSQGVTLRLGCQSGYSWIQSQGNTPLAINPVGNNVGIGTSVPGSSLSVAGGMAIGKTYAQKTTATIPANNVAVEGKVGIGTLAPSATLQVGDTTLLKKIFSDLTTVGILQPAADTVGLSIRKLDGHAALQFCVYDKAGNNPLCNYIQGERGTGDILIGPTDQPLRVTANGKVSAPNLALAGNLTINGEKKSVLEFSFTGKETSAGKIGYKVFSDDLDIVGAGIPNSSRKVRVWDELETAKLALTGGATMRADAKQVFEFGFGVADKQIDAGKIGYKVFSPGLDIVGATSDIKNRQIHLWDEVYVRGNLWLMSGGFWCRLDSVNPVKSGNWDWAVYRSSSDVRLKTSVTPIPLSLDKVRKLTGCSYHWSDDAIAHFTKDIDTLQPVETVDHPLTPKQIEELRQKERQKQREFLRQPQIGVLAQDVEAVLPEAVTTDKDGFKSVNYQHLIPLLIEAIKEQDRAVAAQAALISRQQTEIEQLKSKIR